MIEDIVLKLNSRSNPMEFRHVQFIRTEYGI